MRTRLRGKFTLLFMMLGMLLAVPAVALADNIQDNIADSVASSLQLTAGDANSDKTAEIRIIGNSSMGDPDGGCNFDPSTTTTESLTITFNTPNGVTATAVDGATANAGEMNFTVCGVDQTVKFSASSSAAPGNYTVTANIVANNTGGTFANQVSIPITVKKPTSITDVSGTGTSGNPGSANLTAKLSSGTDDMQGKTVSFKVTKTGVCDDNTADLTLPDCPAATATTGPGGVANANNVSLPSTFTAANSPYTITASYAGDATTAAGFYAPSSGTGNLVVTPPCTAPSVTTHPSAQEITYGANASFTAAASGTSPSVQWQVSTDDGANFSNISGAQSTTLSLTKPLVADSGNQYRAVFTNSCGNATTNAATLTVNPKALTVSGITANNKIYNGDTSATLNFANAELDGVVDPDVVEVDENSNYSANFADEDVANGIAVTVSGLGLTGADAGNYTLTQPTGLTANITPKGLDVSGLSAQNKVWDGNTTAQITGTAALDPNEIIAGDVVSVTGTPTGTFNTAAVGTNKPVTVLGLSLDGTDKGNYSLNQLVLHADILGWSPLGFYSPVGTDNSMYQGPNDLAPVFTADSPLNTVKGGSTVPLKFEIFAGSVEKTSTDDVLGFAAKQLSGCAAGADEDAVDFTTTGSTTLRYDTTAGQFIQNWKTPTVKYDTCYRATVTFDDGTSIHAFFKLRK
jgi:YDG domain